jgi:hypothetical protein
MTKYFVLIFFLLILNCNKKDEVSDKNLNDSTKIKSIELLKCRKFVDLFKNVGDTNGLFADICESIENDSFYMNWKISLIFGYTGIHPLLEKHNFKLKNDEHYHILCYDSPELQYRIYMILKGDQMWPSQIDSNHTKMDINLYEICSDNNLNKLKIIEYDAKEIIKRIID